MVGSEAGGADDHGPDVLGGEGPQALEDVRPEPRLRRPAGALPADSQRSRPEAAATELGGAPELVVVRVAVGDDPDGQAVRRHEEEQLAVVPCGSAHRPERLDRSAHPLGEQLDQRRDRRATAR